MTSLDARDNLPYESEEENDPEEPDFTGTVWEGVVPVDGDHAECADGRWWVYEYDGWRLDDDSDSE